MLETLEVDKWEALPGTPLRVRIDDKGGIEAIGHFLKDQWFNPMILFEQLQASTDWYEED